MNNQPKTIKEIRQEAQMFITDKEFNEELTSHFNISRKIAEEENQKKGEVGIVPKLFIVSRKEEQGKKIAALVAFAGVDFNDSDVKRKTMFGLGAKMFEDKFDPIAVFLISEAWISQGSAKDDSMPLKKDDEGNILPPSQQPVKSEAMVIAGRTIDGRENLATIIYKRSGGKMFFLDDTKMIVPYDPDKENDNYSKSDLLSEFFKGYLMAFGVKKVLGGDIHGN